MRFKIDWANLIAGNKYNIFALFYYIFEGKFPSTSSQGAYIWRGDLTEGFLRYRFRGLIFGGAYFRNFTVLNENKLRSPDGRRIRKRSFPSEARSAMKKKTQACLFIIC